jgi:hypothetical protein
MALLLTVAAILAALVYIAQLLRKILWVLALVTRNQMVAAKLANQEQTHLAVLGFGGIRFPWLFRNPEIENR